jgi:hypothetical protein
MQKGIVSKLGASAILMRECFVLGYAGRRQTNRATGLPMPPELRQRQAAVVCRAERCLKPPILTWYYEVAGLQISSPLHGGMQHLKGVIPQ